MERGREVERKEGRETGKGGRPGRERGGKGREKKGGWDRVRERSGTGREGRLFENVARGGGPHPKWPGAPSHLKTALLHLFGKVERSIQCC